MIRTCRIPYRPMIGCMSILAVQNRAGAAGCLHGQHPSALPAGCHLGMPASGTRSLALATTTADPVAPKRERVRRHGSRDHQAVRNAADTTDSAAWSCPNRRCPPAPSEIYSRPQEGDVMTTDPRSALSSDDRDYPPGPLAGVKRGATSDPGYPQPQAAEVESARLLSDQARQEAARRRGSRTKTSTGWPMTSSPVTAAKRPGRSSSGRTASGGPPPRRHTALSTSVPLPKRRR